MYTTFGDSFFSTNRKNRTSCEKLKGLCQGCTLKIAPEEELRSYEVSALFTSILVNTALVFMKEIPTNDVTLKNRIPLSPKEITKLLELCLNVHIFLIKISTTSKFMVLPWDIRSRQLSVTC